MSQWQPIETAPKDEPVLVRWVDGDGQDYVMEAFYGEPFGIPEWVVVYSDDLFEMGGMTVTLDCGDVTHWMPKPEVPE